MELLTVVPIFLLLIIIQNEAVSAKKRITKYPRYDCACGEINNKILNKIVGGKITKPHAYPWIALINFVADNEKRMGAGTIINDFYILTVAHLVNEIPIKNFTIGLGVHNREKRNTKRYQSYKVKESIIHQSFSDAIGFISIGFPLVVNDIALLKVDRRIMFTDFVKPICLPNKNEKIEHEIATVIGWGQTTWNDQKYSPLLQETQVEVLTRRECQPNFSMSGDTMICTSGLQHRPSNSDSGGPLFYTNQHGIAVQIGITSLEDKEYDVSGPAFYTSVTLFLDWIREHTKATQYCYKEL